MEPKCVYDGMSVVSRLELEAHTAFMEYLQQQSLKTHLSQQKNQNAALCQPEVKGCSICPEQDLNGSKRKIFCWWWWKKRSKKNFTCTLFLLT